MYIIVHKILGHLQVYHGEQPRVVKEPAAKAIHVLVVTGLYSATIMMQMRDDIIPHLRAKQTPVTTEVY